ALRPVTPGAPALALDDMFQRLRDPRDPRTPRTGAVWLEEASYEGALVQPAVILEAVRMAHQRGIPVILDGSLLLHAAAALGSSPAALARGADLVILSPGLELGGSTASVLAGEASLVERAGGSPAEADAGSWEGAADALRADNSAAARLAEDLRRISGVRVDRPPEANVVLFRLPGWTDPADSLLRRMEARGILLDAPSGAVFKLHLRSGADEAEFARFASELGSLLASGGPPPGVN
ncbi:MAG: hypothetical protein KGL53_12350, partial [Elusimicrobia bacterium]|nr:hypothetical protein [Elusimicrobiota bacterium]